MERKFAAILAADVAGISRLMERDEDSTLDALRSHCEVVDGLIAARRRRVFNRVGEATNRRYRDPAGHQRAQRFRAGMRLEFRIRLGARDFAGRGRRL